MNNKESDESHVDFGLVSTYLPSIFLWFRCSVIIMSFEAFKMAVKVRGDLILLLLAVVVYFDAYLFRSDKIAQGSGFSIACTLAWMANTWPVAPHCEELHMTVLNWSLDLIWAVSSSLFYLHYTMHQKYLLCPHKAAFFWSCMIPVQSLTRCRKQSLYEMIARVAVFYQHVMFSYYIQFLSPGYDRNVHPFVIMHIAQHLLYVNPFVFLGSIFVFIFVCFRTFLPQTTVVAGGKTSSSVGSSVVKPTGTSANMTSSTSKMSSDELLVARLKAGNGV